MNNSCAVWDFRSNKDYYTVETLINWLKNNCKKYCFQLERGDSGYEHWQGRFSLIKKRRKSELLKLFSSLPAPNYLEPTSTTHHCDEYFYAMKEDTRIDGPYKDDFKETYIPRQYRNITLLPWQQKIADSANVFEPRKINWVYDNTGCSGKTTVASICELLHGGIDIPPINDFKEIIQIVCDICIAKQCRDPKIVFFDLPRAFNKDKLYGIISAMEQIKKGKLYDLRYNYKEWWIDSPQIWIFSNTTPDTSLLSTDRWCIWEIRNNELTPFTNPLDNLN